MVGFRHGIQAWVFGTMLLESEYRLPSWFYATGMVCSALRWQEPQAERKWSTSCQVSPGGDIPTLRCFQEVVKGGVRCHPNQWSKHQAPHHTMACPGSHRPEPSTQLGNRTFGPTACTPCPASVPACSTGAVPNSLGLRSGSCLMQRTAPRPTTSQLLAAGAQMADRSCRGLPSQIRAPFGFAKAPAKTKAHVQETQRRPSCKNSLPCVNWSTSLPGVVLPAACMRGATVASACDKRG